MITAILQARMSSSRLPGKVMLPLAGKPMLVHQIERIKRARRIDRLMVATSTEVSDDPIVELCEQLGVACFRGSLDDVLDRFYQAATRFGAEHIVRLTGDCPLIDPIIIDAVIRQHVATAADYTSNCRPPTLPDGLDVEVFTFGVLQRAWAQATRPSEREHVTLYVSNHPELFNIALYAHAPDLSGLRWTVDNPEDYRLISAVYDALYPQCPEFGLGDVLTFLRKRPSLMEINRHIPRNQGMEKSLKQDEEQRR